MEIKFFMAMDPPTVTAQEHKVMVRNGKPVFYDPPELKAARQKLTDYLAQYKPEQTLTGPLELVTTWCFPTEAEWQYSSYKITRPDTDNLNKMLKDCMTAVGFWHDDAQVCREIIEKFWVSPNLRGIFVKVTQL
ncbi:MAG: RusA family crossover junction endodeoxyribonuclease [Oscillospiraceae bacterium]|nr:RusA family crossover junction endodeoxyribonuclease [Oscillospiraceae bacterium]MBO7726985.1 RusA family crossover junction endodeoxyribonuclease [Oscillospiraceae bacterium]